MRIPNQLQTFQLLGAINLRSPFGLRDHRMILLAMLSGLRVSELAGLDVGMVLREDAQPRELLDLPPHLAKFHKARQIPLNARAQRVILDLVDFNRARGFSVAPEAPLFQNRYHRRLLVRHIQRLVKLYREKADLDLQLTPHSLRHHFATELVRKAGNVRGAQMLLGHKRINTTQRYLHPDLQDLTDMIAQLE